MNLLFQLPDLRLSVDRLSNRMHYGHSSIMKRFIHSLVISLVCLLPAAVSAADPTSFAAQVGKIQEAAKTGDIRAMGIIANLRRSSGANLTEEECMKAARSSVEAHDPMGMYAMALRYVKGDGVEKNRAKSEELARGAVKGLKPLADGGDVWAELLMGLACNGGFGCEKNPTEGIAWLRKAADQGLAPAQVCLGRCDLLGLGVPRDFAAAAALFQKAADQGHAEGALLLGACYQSGNGVPKSASTAIEWMRRAAEAGNPLAEYVLGRAYASGRGAEKNPAEAATWFKKAAEQGHAEAQFNLGYLYKKGLGVDKSTVEALKWLRMGAMNGSVTAEMLLSVMYLNGDGVARDREEAKRWLFMAANSTNPSYRRLRDQASKAMERLTASGTSGAPLSSVADLLHMAGPSLGATPPPESMKLHDVPKNVPQALHSGSEDDVTSGSLLFQPGKPEDQ